MTVITNMKYNTYDAVTGGSNCKGPSTKHSLTSTAHESAILMLNPARLCDEHFAKLFMSQSLSFTSVCKAESNKSVNNPQK